MNRHAQMPSPQTARASGGSAMYASAGSVLGQNDGKGWETEFCWLPTRIQKL
jgi:hypothetical protein